MLLALFHFRNLSKGFFDILWSTRCALCSKYFKSNVYPKRIVFHNPTVMNLNKRILKHRNTVKKSSRLVLGLNTYKGGTGDRLKDIFEGSSVTKETFVQEVIRYLM